MLANILDWPVDSLRRIARQHAIEISEEGADEVARITMRRCAAKRAAIAASSTTVKKPAEKKPQRKQKNNGRRSGIKDHPRTEYTTIALSKAAMQVLNTECRRVNKSLSGTASIAVDYLARNGKLGEVIDTALAELAGP